MYIFGIMSHLKRSPHDQRPRELISQKTNTKCLELKQTVYIIGEATESFPTAKY